MARKKTEEEHKETKISLEQAPQDNKADFDFGKLREAAGIEIESPIDESHDETKTEPEPEPEPEHETESVSEPVQEDEVAYESSTTDDIKAQMSAVAKSAFARGKKSGAKSLESLQAELEAAKAELAELRHDKMISDVASQTGVDPSILKETRIDDEDEMRTFAQRLSASRAGSSALRSAVTHQENNQDDGWSLLAAQLRRN